MNETCPKYSKMQRIKKKKNQLAKSHQRQNSSYEQFSKQTRHELNKMEIRKSLSSG